MNTDEALRRLKARYGTPARMMRALGLDQDPDSEPATPLEFLRSRMDPEDLDEFLNRLLIESNQRGREAEDRRRRAADAEREGALPTGELRKGITESAPAAQDAKPASASETFAEMFHTTHTPGTC